MRSVVEVHVGFLSVSVREGCGIGRSALEGVEVVVTFSAEQVAVSVFMCVVSRRLITSTDDVRYVSRPLAAVPAERPEPRK